MKRTVFPADAGFTLAELLVASLLISLTMTGVYVMFVSMIASWNANERKFDRFLEARALLDSVERDVNNVLPAAGHLFEGKKDEITMFVVEQPMAIPKSDGPHLMRVNYEFERNSREVVREEALVTTALPQAPPPDKPLDRGRIKLTKKTKTTVGSNVKSFRFRYIWFLAPKPRKPEEQPVWADPEYFDSQRERWGLPQGIELSIEIEDPESKEIFPMTVTYPLRCQTFMLSEKALGKRRDETK